MTKFAKPYTVDQLEAMSSKELVALFNEYSRKPVTKFADRKTAVKRVFDVLLEEQQDANAKPQATVVKVVAAKSPKLFDLANMNTKPAKAKAKAKDRSAAIAASWADPVIAAKRAERTHVKASGTLYRSVREAFEQLGLPLSKHIKFRMELKSVQELTFKHEGRQVKFSVVAPE